MRKIIILGIGLQGLPILAKLQAAKDMIIAATETEQRSLIVDNEPLIIKTYHNELKDIPRYPSAKKKQKKEYGKSSRYF